MGGNPHANSGRKIVTLDKSILFPMTTTKTTLEMMTFSQVNEDEEEKEDRAGGKEKLSASPTCGALSHKAVSEEG